MATKSNLMSRIWPRRRVVLGCAGIVLAASAVAAPNYGGWKRPINAQTGSDPALNTEFNDGCPILSHDGLSLYLASNRPGGLGGQDIWVAHRPNTRSGWGAPVNLGAPVNSAFDDFCPAPGPDRTLFFVSRRDEPNGDIYRTRSTGRGWETPVHLGSNINSADQEWSPSWFRDRQGHEVLYFSSTRSGGPGAAGLQDIYYSVDYGPAQLAPGALNTEFDDSRPNVRRDGLEIVFDSTRTGTLGGPDIWTSTRFSTSAPWPAATHLKGLSSIAADTRATLSWDGSYILFGSARDGGEGPADIYVAKRRRPVS